MLEHETWTRVHARKLGITHGAEVRSLPPRIAFVELSPTVLARALEAFSRPVRTLDALQLASMDFLRSQGQVVVLASYDDRLVDAARALRFEMYDA